MTVQSREKDLELAHIEINAGARVTKVLKDMYFADVPWSKCYKKVANHFTEIKVQMREKFPDKTNMELIEEFMSYERV